MAQLTKEQRENLEKQFNAGSTFTSVVNTSYHLNVKVNTEAIVITSMIADDNDRTIIINLNDVRNAFDKDREDRENANAGSEVEDISNNKTES